MPAAVTSCAREQIILGFLLRAGGGGCGGAIMPQTRTQRLERVIQLGKAEWIPRNVDPLGSGSG